MNTLDIPNAIKSAQHTADAWEEIVPVFVMVECEYRAGGQIFHRRQRGNCAPDAGPYRQIASVLPFTYLQLSLNNP